MRRDLFRTLFSRMLASYLTVTLGLLLASGVTVAAILQSQAMREEKAVLIRELAVVSELVAEAEASPTAMADAEAEIGRIARHYGGLVQILQPPAAARSFFYDAKWRPIAGMTYTETELRALMLATGEAGETSVKRFSGHVSFPVLTASRRIADADGNARVLLFHADVTGVQDRAAGVYMETLLAAMIASLIAVVVVFTTTAAMTRPFMEINDIVQRYSKGDYNARIPVTSTEEASQLALSFNAMADQLKDLEATRRSFVANVSHELRSPLTSMRGFLEAMQDGTIGADEYEKYLDIVLSETRRMTSMVNDLLDLARIESGKTALKLEVFDVNELIRRTLLTFEARIYEKRMEVEVKFAAEQCYVEADSAQISQVLRNIIDNAIKYSPDDRKLRIATYALRREVYISIQDFGQGIPEEDVPHVFDRFYKVEKAHTPTKQSGTGLGLSIVKKIIDQHGQTITLKSARGKGSTFTFTLKRAPSPKRQQPDGGRRNGL